MKATLNAKGAILRNARFWTVLSVWAASLLFVLFQGGKTSLMLLAMISILVLYLIAGGLGGIRRVHGRRALTAELDQGHALQAGEQVKVSLQFDVPGFLPMPYVVIREVMKRHNGETWSFEESVIPDFRGSGELTFQTPPLERGRYYFTETECVTEDIFGLVEHKGTFHVPGQFRVLPRTVPISDWKLVDRNSRLAGPQRSAASRRETTQINGVRDYVYGDRISRIHWNATAKTGSWKSKEFEYDSVPKIMVVLDAVAGHYTSDKQFELAVSTAASLIQYAAQKRMCLGLMTAGETPKCFTPTENAGELQRMMHHLVDVTADGFGELQPKLEKHARIFPSGCLLVLVSPKTGGKTLEALRWAGTRGYTPSHILVAPSGDNDKQGWVSMLRTAGTYGCSVSDLKDLPGALGGGVA
ncbi:MULTISPECIES: DUF58 domain-containing protein [Paenibacillus]|uniref:DUF58 domain-containing protein n=1 Tax=Paenibacillus albilobatus TaxID=2716884 RepID=A0A920CC28_9BACL|nr:MULTISPECIES: DUF58 domain-containing protein [Paenibacillus]MDR9853109.1 DUF58 domain-containing protein [Paenibacillus sp. VCA1]GIO34105.1 hypothetical protein J2TS6_52460 [Paenibacillus albilobatus]